MREKTYYIYCIIIVLCFAIIASPVIQACEEQEYKEYKEKCEEKEEYKECNENDSKDESSNLFDFILERYPILNQIIEMVLDLLYNWLSSYYAGTTL